MNVVLGGFLAVFGTAAFAVAVSQVVRRLTPARLQRDFRGHGTPLAVAVGALFAFLTALAVVTGRAELEGADHDVRTEAAATADLYWYASTLTGAAKTQLQSELRAYVSEVQHQEWAELADRRVMSVQAWRLVDQMRKQLQAMEPEKGGDTVRYAQALNRMADLTGARRSREAALTEGIPLTLWLGLYASGILLLAVAIVFGGSNPLIRGILACVTGAGIAFVIFLVQQLDHPFQGAIKVSDAAFSAAAAGFDEIDGVYRG